MQSHCEGGFFHEGHYLYAAVRIAVLPVDLCGRAAAYCPACEAERVVEPDLPWHAGQARRHRARHLCVARADLAAGDIPCK